MIMRHHTAFQSPLGWIRPVSDGTALVRLDWDQLRWPEPDHPDDVSRETVRQLEAYFAGEQRAFDLPLNPEGKSAAAKHWLTIMTTIPYGHTVTYQEFAEAAGYPKAARVAGSICAKNPIPIIYPCHRVLKSDGSLGNYGGGSSLSPAHPENLARKDALLSLEKRF